MRELTVPICDSLYMLVVSEEKDLAMPKSISFRCPLTKTKLAGFRSPNKIPSERLLR